MCNNVRKMALKNLWNKNKNKENVKGCETQLTTASKHANSPLFFLLSLSRSN
jgi:hypothetical protein